MFTLRQWWERNGLQLLLVSLALSSAWWIRQTQGEAIYELYQIITRPLQASGQQILIENARYKELQDKINALEIENKKLTELLAYKQATAKKGITALIIGRSPDHWWQQVTLNKGTLDGIEKDYIVLSAGGFVGRVVSVTNNTSKILLVTDPSSKIGVKVNRSSNMGFIKGNSSNNVIFQFFDKAPDVKKGDIVTTSSISSIVPPNLPIGRIESINVTKNAAPEAVVSLNAPISQLEWVIVVPFKTH